MTSIKSMQKPIITVKNIHWTDTLELRHRILWPTKAKEFCIVDGDEQANHYGALLEDKLVGVASIFQNHDSVQLRKFAVDSLLQGKGVGSQLLRYIIEIQRNNQMLHFHCDARASAVNFYQRFGLSKEGDVFDKSGVWYYKMSLNLQS